MKHYAIFTLFIVLFFRVAIFAQNWAQVQQWGGSGTETCSGLAIAPDGSIFLSGTFQSQIKFGNQILNSQGETDLFLCKLNPNGEVLWAKSWGSVAEDEVANIILDKQGNLTIVGTFWQAIDFEGVRLSAGNNPKTIFIAKYNPDGQLLWAKSVKGSHLKGIADVAVDLDNNLAIGGFFSDSLQIENKILIAKGTTDFFVTKLNSEGQAQWTLQQGKKGDTRVTALDFTSEGDLIAAGFFNDTTQIADTILTANTQDRDIFLTRIRKDGVPRWAKKAGGVFDSDVTSLALDAADNIYLTGYFVGQIRLSETLRIQSVTGNTDFCLLKYLSNGTPNDARALGGNLLQQATDLNIQDSTLIISGFYQGDMTLDGFSLSTPTNTVSGFVAIFDPNFICQQAKNIPSSQALFPNRIAFTKNGSLLTAGSFIGKANFDEQLLTAPNSYDLFLAKMARQTTLVFESKIKDLFNIFPNPTTGRVFIETDLQDFTIRVMNQSGRIISKIQNQRTLDFSQLPKGIYFITFQTTFTNQTQKIVWQ